MAEAVWGIIGAATPAARARVLQHLAGPQRPVLLLDPHPWPSEPVPREHLAQTVTRLRQRGATRLVLTGVRAQAAIAQLDEAALFVDWRTQAIRALADTPPVYTAVLEHPDGTVAKQLATAGVPLIPVPNDRQAAVVALCQQGQHGTEGEVAEAYENLANHLIARGARRVVWASTDLGGFANHVRHRQTLPIVDLMGLGLASAVSAEGPLR